MLWFGLDIQFHVTSSWDLSTEPACVRATFLSVYAAATLLEAS